MTAIVVFATVDTPRLKLSYRYNQTFHSVLFIARWLGMLPIKVWMTEIPFPGHYSVIVVRVPEGTAPSRPVAARFMGSVMTKVSLERLMCHVAIIDGELAAPSAVFGETPEVQWFVATSLDELAQRTWLQVEL